MTSSSNEVAVTRKPRFIVGLEGVEGTGKTRFVMTAPGPILYLGFEYGLEGVADQFPGVRVREERYDLTLPPGVSPKDAAAVAIYRAQMERFYTDAYRAVGAHRTVAIDTASEVWSTTRMAWPEDGYKEQERRFRDLIHHYYKHDATHLILLHRFKAAWKRDKGGKSYKAEGLGERDGMDGILHDLQLALECKFEFPKVAGNVVVEPASWSHRVLKCRDNAGLTGMELPAMDFPSWASMAYPGMDWTK